MSELHNLYAIANKEEYKMFLDNEWEKNNLYWYSDFNSKVKEPYEDLTKRLGLRPEGNMYFRVLHNNITNRDEVCIYTNKQKALEDVKQYEKLNINQEDKLNKISRPDGIERIDDLCRALQFEGKNSPLLQTASEYELKAVNAVMHYGKDWHKHVYEMEPIKVPHEMETVKVEKPMTLEDKIKAAQEKKAEKNQSNEHKTKEQERE